MLLTVCFLLRQKKDVVAVYLCLVSLNLFIKLPNFKSKDGVKRTCSVIAAGKERAAAFAV